MELALEGHSQLAGLSHGLRPVVHYPEVLPEPVLQGDTGVDGYGASIYGSVLRQDGLFRMWYQAWPRDWDGSDAVAVGCAESDDGITWRKPPRGLVEYEGSRDNHLCDLPFHSPSVLVDPTAEPAARYRAFGYTDPKKLSRYDVDVPVRGFYTASSPDGFHWQVEADAPLWPHADVITSVWDPLEDCARICLKWNGLCRGMFRRRFFEATWSNGQATAPRGALIPDELDDINARARGFVSADYYGSSLLPAGSSMVGVLWNFRHVNPLGYAENPGMWYGSNGQVDLSIAYQLERGGRWHHLLDRPDWLAASTAPDWARGALYTASSPIHVGDETWLYFTGTMDWHGWSGVGEDTRQWRERIAPGGGFARIGLLKWPRDRIAGYRADLKERLVLKATEAAAADSAGLRLNLVTRPTGSVRVALTGPDHQPLPGYDFTDCEPLSGSLLNAEVRWQGKTGLPTVAQGEDLFAVIEMESTELYAFEFRRST